MFFVQTYTRRINQNNNRRKWNQKFFSFVFRFKYVFLIGNIPYQIFFSGRSIRGETTIYLLLKKKTNNVHKNIYSAALNILTSKEIHM